MLPEQLLQGVRGLLRAYPSLAITPGPDPGITIEGDIPIERTMASHVGIISDSFAVRIRFPSTYPQHLPSTWEIGARIPRNADHHVNAYGDLCLGNPLRIRLSLASDSDPVGYVERFVIPYLCGISVKLTAGYFPQGELGHGTAGLLKDARELFGLATVEQARAALCALAQRKFRADRMPCPCACGRRLHRCSFGSRIDALRRTLGRDWARRYVQQNGIG